MGNIYNKRADPAGTVSGRACIIGTTCNVTGDFATHRRQLWSTNSTRQIAKRDRIAEDSCGPQTPRDRSPNETELQKTAVVHKLHETDHEARPNCRRQLWSTNSTRQIAKRDRIAEDSWGPQTPRDRSPSETELQKTAEVHKLHETDREARPYCVSTYHLGFHDGEIDPTLLCSDGVWFHLSGYVNSQNNGTGQWKFPVWSPRYHYMARSFVCGMLWVERLSLVHAKQARLRSTRIAQLILNLGARQRQVVDITARSLCHWEGTLLHIE
jgi:hypothetical protein